MALPNRTEDFSAHFQPVDSSVSDGKDANIGDFAKVFEPAHPEPSLTEQASVAGQGATGAMVETGSLIGGAVGGFKMGAAVAPLAGPFAPAVPLLGAGVGAFLGQEFGRRSREELSSMRLPDGSPVTFNKISDLPPDLRPAGVAGEVVGGSVVPTFGMTNLALKGWRLPDTTVVGSWLNRVLDTVGTSTKTFLGVEAATSASAGVGGAIAETVAPGEMGPRLGAEIGFGMINPTRAVSVMGKLTSNIWHKGRQLLSPGALENDAAKVLQTAFEASGEDPVLLARIIKESGIPGVDQTVAQMTGSQALAGMEKELRRYSVQFGRESEQMASEGLDSIRATISALQSVGDPAAVRMAAEMKANYVGFILNSRLQRAEGEAVEAISKMSRDTPDDISNISTVASEKIFKAWDEAKTVERELWSSVRKDIAAGGSNIKETFAQVKSELLRSEKSGKLDIAEQFIKDVSEGKTPLLTGDLVKFRSRMLELAREAAPKKPSLSRRLNLMADAAMDDLDIAFSRTGSDVPLSVPGAVSPETAYNEARSFTRMMNDTFKRTFVGKVMAKSVHGQTMPPEVMLRRALAGGREAAALRMQELEEATTFLPRMGRDSQESLENFNMMIESQERMIRVVASEAVDPKTGKLNTRSLGRFLRSNETLLKRFPEAKKSLENALTSSDAAENLERVISGQNKLISSRAAFSKILGFENPADAVRAALSGRNPIGDIEGMARLANKGGSGAVAGLKSAIHEHVVRAGGESLSEYSRLMFAPIREGQPSVIDVMRTAGLLNTTEVKQIENLLTQAAKIDASMHGGVIAHDIDSPYDLLVDLITRGVGAGTATKLMSGTSAHSLIVARGGSQFAQNIFKKLPAKKVKDLLIQASTDPELMAMLLTKTKTQPEKIKLGLQMHSYLVSSGWLAADEETQ